MSQIYLQMMQPMKCFLLIFHHNTFNPKTLDYVSKI